MSLPQKIVSGGQTGADRAGLDYAIENNIEHGGWCPQGRRSEDGAIPAHYNLRETADWGYKDRTKLNVRDSDCTVIFNRGTQLSSGSALTLRCCERMDKPSLVLHLPESKDRSLAGQHIQGQQLAEFLAFYRPAVLNVAGNREVSSPGISDWVRGVLASAWEHYAEATKTTTPNRAQQASLFGMLDARENARKSR